MFMKNNKYLLPLILVTNLAPAMFLPPADSKSLSQAIKPATLPQNSLDAILSYLTLRIFIVDQRKETGPYSLFSLDIESNSPIIEVKEHISKVINERSINFRICLQSTDYETDTLEANPLVSLHKKILGKEAFIFIAPLHKTLAVTPKTCPGCMFWPRYSSKIISRLLVNPYHVLPFCLLFSPNNCNLSPTASG